MPTSAAMSALFVDIFRLNGRLLARGDEIVAPLGLTSARWQVLGAAALSGEAASVAQLARRMGLTRQSVQRIVNDLIAAGLVVMADNPDHRRARLVRLTPSGQAAYAAAMARQATWVAQLSKGFTAGEIEAAQTVLRRLAEALK